MHGWALRWFLDGTVVLGRCDGCRSGESNVAAVDQKREGNEMVDGSGIEAVGALSEDHEGSWS